MRHFLGALCAIAAALSVGGSATAADGAWAPVGSQAARPAQSASPACLGGVLNEGATRDYLTVADYPAFAAITDGLRRIFICGDSIPPILPSSERAGFVSRHR